LSFAIQLIDWLMNKGDDELLLQLHCTGLCYSDIHYMLQDLAMPKMSDTGVKSPGHEGIGTVVKVGKKVSSWKIGDRGGVKPLWDVCHECELCFGGHETHCPKGRLTGLVEAGMYND
jgi:alcohol dehydrogenase, propanol-preferring